MPVYAAFVNKWVHTHKYIYNRGLNVWYPRINEWIYNKEENKWYRTYKYEWEPSTWNTCTEECGGGTQTRTMKCIRKPDNTYVDEKFCLAYDESMDEPDANVLKDITFECTQNQNILINKNKILENSTIVGTVVELIISEITNCSISTDGNYYTITPLVDYGQICYFKFAVKDGKNNISSKATVNIDILPVPPEANMDTFTVQQGKTLDITKAQLLSNDTYERTITSVQTSGTPVGTTVVNSTEGFTITPSARYQEPCSFNYTITDSANLTSNAAQVNINITMLDEINALIFPSSDLQDYITSSGPPTLQDIFNKWPRFYNTYYYPSGTTPAGEAASWEWNTSLASFRCTVNSSYLTGMVSPEVFDSYDLSAKLSSTDSDNDLIGIVLAHYHDGSTNHVLVFAMETGGFASSPGKYAYIVYYKGNTRTCVGTMADTSKWSSGGWNAKSPAQVKVSRRGTVFTCQASAFNSTVLSTGGTITLDTSTVTTVDLSWVNAKRAYGYCCQSQNYSSFANVEFESSSAMDNNTVLDATTGQVYEAINNKWVLSSTKTVQDVLDYPRYVYNPETKKRYYITKDSITEVS